MPGSIYQFVKQKLLNHGVDQTPDGLITLTDKPLFLAFVRLERAVRIADFDAVQSAAKRIAERSETLGKRHLIVFSYMYLRFADGTPNVTHADVRKADGGVVRSVEYRRPVTPGERLIADWGRLRDQCYGKHLLRAVYASRE